MYNQDLTLLSEILDVNMGVPEEKFNMRSYCGTSCCLVGNAAIHLDRFKSSGRTMIVTDPVNRVVNSVSKTISLREYLFLFTRHRGNANPAENLTQKQALTRLAKFIVYKRKKKEMWEDYEKARRVEGDNMYCVVTPQEIEHEQKTLQRLPG